jgi:hypothetical protein
VALKSQQKAYSNLCEGDRCMPSCSDEWSGENQAQGHGRNRAGHMGRVDSSRRNTQGRDELAEEIDYEAPGGRDTIDGAA